MEDYIGNYCSITDPVMVFEPNKPIYVGRIVAFDDNKVMVSVNGNTTIESDPYHIILLNDDKDYKELLLCFY